MIALVNYTCMYTYSKTKNLLCKLQLVPALLCLMLQAKSNRNKMLKQDWNFIKLHVHVIETIVQNKITKHVLRII